MTAATLLLGAALDLLSFALYAGAGALVRSTIPRDEAHARTGFATFWYAVAVVNLLQAGLILLAVAGLATDALAEAVWQTRIALALTGFAGLVYYLLYVWTGSRRLLVPTAAFYGLTFLLMMVWMAQGGAATMSLDPWRVDLDYAIEEEGALYKTVVVMFFLPPVLAAGAYALVLRHVHEARQRRRVLLISLSLGAYFVGLTVGYLETGHPHWGLIENLIGIAAALGVTHALRTTREAAT